MAPRPQTETPAFICEKCQGTGVAWGGKCYTCRGNGGWSKSPQQREAARLATKKKREREAQRDNIASKVFSMASQLEESGHPTARGMMEMHRAGKRWTPHQIYTIRAIRKHSATGNEIAKKIERASIIDEGEKK